MRRRCRRRQKEDYEEQDVELEEAANIDPVEIDDIIEDEANPNKHQDDGDHQESEENTEIKELRGSEPVVPSESETHVPLDPPHNESDTGAVESGPSNLDAEEQEEELEKSKPRRSTRETNPVMRLAPSMTGKSYLQENYTQVKG